MDKTHLKPQDLQGELIILTFFLLNGMLRTKICWEFWARQQRL